MDKILANPSSVFNAQNTFDVQRYGIPIIKDVYLGELPPDDVDDPSIDWFVAVVSFQTRSLKHVFSN